MLFTLGVSCLVLGFLWELVPRLGRLFSVVKGERLNAEPAEVPPAPDGTT